MLVRVPALLPHWPAGAWACRRPPSYGMAGWPGTDEGDSGTREMAERMGTASRAQNEGQSLGFERLVFFSDAVFAIVITLLVLPLTAELEVPQEGVDLVHEVFGGHGLRMLTFAVGFLVVGQFWIAHHRMFGHLRRADHGLMWFNLVSLMTVAFMPFPTALLGASPLKSDRFPVVFSR
jgi:uncharacterized membrane protein